MLLTAGCGFIGNNNLAQQYDASDGTSVDVGNIQVRNAILFTTNDKRASLSMTVLNEGAANATATFQYPTATGTKTKEVTVPGESQVRLGTQGGDDQLILTGITHKPGSLLKVYVQAGSASGKNLQVPILNGALGEYKTLLPSPVQATPTSTSSATPLPQATNGSGNN